MDVFEAALPGVAFGGGMQREEPLPAFARGAGARIEQQVGFGGKAQQGSAVYFFFTVSSLPFLRHNYSREEEWISEVRKRIRKILRSMNAFQRVEVRFLVAPNEHGMNRQQTPPIEREQNEA